MQGNPARKRSILRFRLAGFSEPAKPQRHVDCLCVDCGGGLGGELRGERPGDRTWDDAAGVLFLLRGVRRAGSRDGIDRHGEAGSGAGGSAGAGAGSALVFGGGDHLGRRGLVDLHGHWGKQRDPGLPDRNLLPAICRPVCVAVFSGHANEPGDGGGGAADPGGRGGGVFGQPGLRGFHHRGAERENEGFCGLGQFSWKRPILRNLS